MRVQDIKAFKTVYYPRIRSEEKDKEINEMLSDGWQLLRIDENPNKSSYMYFVHEEEVKGLEE